MVSNKKRLYIALYSSGAVSNEERRYHWAFLVGPKSEDLPQVPGKRYHVKNHPIEGWVYEEVDIADVRVTNNLLARITVAKITDEKRLVNIFRTVPIVQNDPTWRCRSWVSGVLSALKTDRRAVGTSQLDWAEIEPLAGAYVEAKIAAGRYAQAEDVGLPRPTWDMLKGKEVVA